MCNKEGHKFGKKRIFFFCFSRTHQLCACIKIEITRQWFLINFHLKRPLLCFSHSLTIHVILWTNCWLITWLSGYHLSSSCVFHCSSFFFWCLKVKKKMKSSTEIHLFLYYFLLFSPFCFMCFRNVTHRDKAAVKCNVKKCMKKGGKKTQMK